MQPLSQVPRPARGRGSLRARLVVALSVSTASGLLLSIGWTTGTAGVVGRAVVLGCLALIVFSAVERWPSRLPVWLPRWAVQVACVALAMPMGAFVIYVGSTANGAPPFWEERLRFEGFAMLSVMGALVAPWVALGALVRQREALAEEQALAFALERSELAQQALSARLTLLQAQVTPHFLFNTLANVQALVDNGSPTAGPVLSSLITYLRAAVPRLNDSVSTVAREVELAVAYLQLMQMRMPDRLRYEVTVAPDAMAAVCPPMTLLALVENAVRHGIDPSEEGGHIDVSVERHGERCTVAVRDTGVGLGRGGAGLGTGLEALRARMAALFGAEARCNVGELAPRGTCAEVEFPCRLGGPR